MWKARDLAIACDAGEELARIHAGLNQSLRRLGRTAETRAGVARRHQVRRRAWVYGNSFWPAMNYMLAELLAWTSGGGTKPTRSCGALVNVG